MNQHPFRCSRRRSSACSLPRAQVALRNLRLAAALLAAISLWSVESARAQGQFGPPSQRNPPPYAPPGSEVGAGNSISYCSGNDDGSPPPPEPILLAGSINGSPPIEIGAVTYPDCMSWPVPDDPALIGTNLTVTAYDTSGNRISSHTWTITLP